MFQAKRGAPIEARPTNVRWLILSMLVAFAMLGHFCRISMAVAGSERFIPVEGVSEVRMGYVYSAFLLAYTLCMIPGGWVIDAVGPRWALTGMGVGYGLFVIATGALGWSQLPVVELLVPLMVVRGIAGGMSAPLHPGMARAVQLWMPWRARATANGLVAAGALVGIAFTPVVFGGLLDRLPWPWAFVAAGAALVVYSLIWHALSADDPCAHGWTNESERSLVVGVSHAGRTPTKLRDLVALLGNRHLALLTLSYGAFGYFQYLFFYWIGFYFNEKLGLPIRETREATLTIYLSMAAGMAVGGMGADLICRRLGFRWGCRCVAATGMILSAALAWRGINATAPEDVVRYFSLAMAALGACEGPFWATASALGARRGGLAGALLNTGGNIGGTISPTLTAWIGASRLGWTWAIGVACAVGCAGGLLWLGVDVEASADGDSER